MNTKNVLLGILIVVVFAVGFMVGRFSSDSRTYMVNTDSEQASVGTNTDEGGVNTSDSAGKMSTGTVEAGTKIETSSLSDGQKKLLGALGIDTDSITVTPEMIACAETRLGPTRIDEITNGATPSFTEGLNLAACYK